MEIPLLRPFGEPSGMKIVVEGDFELGYILNRINIEGDLRLIPHYDSSGNIECMTFPDVLHASKEFEIQPGEKKLTKED